MRRMLRSFARGRSGNVAVMAALGGTVLVGVAGFAVDAGKGFVDRRHAQSIADLAALAAAANPAHALLLARGTAGRNGIAPTDLVRAETGTYVADPSLPAAQRFTPGPAAGANAVRVTVATTTPTYFARLIGAPERLAIRTSATASSTAIASFSIGTRLPSLDGGVLNQLLGHALGTEIGLSLMDYRALADLRIDAFDFIDALATRAKLTGPTYDDVLAGDVKVVDALQALVDAGTSGGARPPVAALLVDLQRKAGTSAKIALGRDIDLGPYARLPLAEHPPGHVSPSALDVLTAIARLADGTRQAGTALGLDIPGLAAAKVTVSVGERPVSSGWTAVGRPGATVTTAQTRLRLDVTIAPVGLGLIHLPIHIDVAKATAELSSVRCPAPSRPRQVTLRVTPAVAQAWIGAIPSATWDGMRDVGSPGPATIMKLGLLTVTGKSHVLAGTPQPKTVEMSSADIDAARVKTVTSSGIVGSLTASLVGDLELGVALGGLGLGLAAQKPLITAAISAVAAPLDATVDTLLAYLGVGLGEADVWVDGLRCDDAVLVH